VLGCFWHPAFYASAGLAALYGAFILLVSVLTAFQTELKLLPLLPVAFVCFQLGYGYGFLRGLIDFVIFHNAPHTRFVQLTRARRSNIGEISSSTK